MTLRARDIELYLLAHMRGVVAVRATLASLQLTNAQMQAASQRVSEHVTFARSQPIGFYQRALGEPTAVEPEPGIPPDSAFVDSQRYRFRLSLWPALDFVIRRQPYGYAWGPEFFRRPGRPIPAFDRPEDLEPWSVVESEVRERLGPPAAEDGWERSSDLVYVVPRSSDRIELRLEFDYSLLQRVVVASPSAQA